MLAKRYWVSGLEGTEKCVIWDSTLVKYLGDGKGGFATFDSWVQAEDVVEIMRERVGA